MRTNKLAELIGENGEIPFSIISVATVYKYEFNPEMSTQSSLSQPESAGSAFSNAAGPFFNGWSRPVGYILTGSFGNS